MPKRILTAKGNGKRFKRTPQRLAILDYLDGNTAHPSAEDVYRAVSERYDSMSFATVYNTLNTLSQAGAVRELTIDPDRKRYDPDTSMHHHLICVGCRKIVDIPDTVGIEMPKDAAPDFKIIGSHVEFYGQCPTCRKKKPASS
jgi:Fur family peroxide stress response transcriptional regulator